MSEFEILRVGREGKRDKELCILLDEYYVNLRVNGGFKGRIICTNSNLQEMIYGNLYCSGILKSLEQVKSFKSEKINKNEENVYVEVEEVTVLDDKDFLFYYEKPNKYDKSIDSIVFRIADTFKEEGALHKKTGATHSVLLFEKDEFFFQAEDISRHNAVDKAIGYYFMHKEDFNVPIVFTSGRVPTDMIEKLYKAGLKVLISKSVPTKQAVKYAFDHGILLICRAWPDSFDVYSCF